MSRYTRKAFNDALAADKKANPELYRNSPLCPTVAETHANLLLSMYGAEKALEKAQEKFNDSLFLVNGEPDFWRQVVAALRTR
jgi:hypothetical protein